MTEVMNFFSWVSYSCSNVPSAFEKYPAWQYSIQQPRLASIISITVNKALTLDAVTEKNEKSLQKQDPQIVFQRKETNYVVIIGIVFLMTLYF